MRMVRIRRINEGALDFGTQREPLHDPANPPLAHPSASATQVPLHRVVTSLGEVSLHGLDGSAKADILALARRL